LGIALVRQFIKKNGGWKRCCPDPYEGGGPFNGALKREKENKEMDFDPLDA